MDPLKEGEQITAAKINKLYDNSTGLTTTVNNIVGDQVRKEGITRRVINTATTDNVKDGSAAAGWGHPWVQVNYFRIDQNQASQTIAGTTRTQLTRGGGLTYELDLNDYCVAFNNRTNTTPHEGDIVVVEWTGTVTVEGKLTAANNNAAATYVTGQNYYTDFAQFDIQAQVQYNGVGSDLQTGGVDFPGTRPKIGSFISCRPAGAPFTIGNEGISPTDAFNTAGVGSVRSVRMTAIYMIRGSETQLVFSVHCKPGIYGTSDGTITSPRVLIQNDNFTATVYRKGVEKV